MRDNGETQALSKEGPIVEYMRSREIYRSGSIAILVDAFRHIRTYIKSCSGIKENDNNNNDNNETNDCMKTMNGFRVLFFLSHFHSDHYNGITNSWRHGIIYASRSTANILCWKLGVEESYVRRMEFFVEYVFSLTNGELLYEYTENDRSMNCSHDYFSVRLIPANHCPGAVMFLFYSPIFGTILHTGDFRFNGGHSNSLYSTLSRPQWEFNMADDPVLKCITGNVNTLYLDNTYCDPRFEFPTHTEVLREVNQTLLHVFSERALALQRDNNNNNHHHHRNGDCKSEKDKDEKRGKKVSVAVLIGTYFIGKERIALSIQETFLPFPNRNEEEEEEEQQVKFIPTYVSPEKYRSLQELDYYPNRFIPFSQSNGDISSGFNKHEVQLPENILGSSSPSAASSSSLSSRVVRSLFPVDSLGLAEESCEETRYFLTPILIPLSSLDFPSLSAVCGKQVKRQRSDITTAVNGIEDSDKRLVSYQEMLPLWDNEMLDLKQFDGVLCVIPTGWTKKIKKYQMNSYITLLHVPYSEHSSFSELLDFVQFINPERIVPTVSPELFKRHEVLFAEKAPRLRQQYSNTQPLSRFFSSKSIHKVEEALRITTECTKIISSQLQKQRNPFAPTNTLAETNTINEEENSCNLEFRSVSTDIMVNKREGDKYSSSQSLVKHELYSTIIEETNISTYDEEVNSVNERKELKSSLNDQKAVKAQSTLLSWSSSSVDVDNDDCVCVGINPSIIDISDSSD
ncbi:DNA cross-link repair 1A protein [Trypanosoma theileri]|uniref:Protein artemis n=1 Tax=Trypanosoma theileri TaxID=67003 RepID=A0A1X0P9Y1_9TRYP|nr:DNA cross-link repair 1A protein [Trypanosoma theileri]ORC93726.1 DNA cross-link repair 1A protein [Trypanosoma theileri]